MFGLSYLGMVHTAISLVAVFAGIAAFLRDGRITSANGLGKVYIGFTVATCVTALGIFAHGGFGPPHAVALLTLLVLGIAWAARATKVFGRASLYVETVGYSATFLFHMIPAVTETSTRLPLGAPLLANADAPVLKTVYAGLLVVFLVGAAMQVAMIRRAGGAELRRM